MSLRTRTVAALVACTVLAGACLGGEEPTIVKARFADVVDLTENNGVKIADVQVGTITAIELTDDLQALVTMEVDPDIDLPADLRAALRKTSVLGERYVELIPQGGGGQFESGTEITDTRVVADLEEVIASSTDLIVAVSADTLAGAIASQARGLDGRGQTFGQIIDDLAFAVSAYDDNSDDLTRLIRGLDDFLDTVAPAADMQGEALAESADFMRVLAEEDDRLIDTLVGLRDLANTGEDIILTHRQRIDDFWFRIDGLTDEIDTVTRSGELDRLLIMLNGHNVNTIDGVRSEHAQVFLDFIFCGVNDIPNHPVRACSDPPQGRPRPDVRPPQDF